MFAPNEGIDRSHTLGIGRDTIDQVHGLHFVWDGEVEPKEVALIEERDGFGEILGRNVEAVISPVAEARVGSAHLGYGRVMHRGAD